MHTTSLNRLLDLSETLLKGGHAHERGWVMRILLNDEYAYYCADEHDCGSFFTVSTMLASHSWWQRRSFGIVVRDTADSEDFAFAEARCMYPDAETVPITVEPALTNVDVHL